MNEVIESTWYARQMWLWWCCFQWQSQFQSFYQQRVCTHTQCSHSQNAHLAISKILVSGWGHLKCWKEPGFEWGKFYGRCLGWRLCVLQGTEIPKRSGFFWVCLFFCYTLGTSRMLGVRSAQELEVHFSSLTFLFVLFCFSVPNSVVDYTTFFGSNLLLRLSRGTHERLIIAPALLFIQCLDLC